MPSEFDKASVRFDEETGLVPAVIQDAADGTVLMLGYMNEESLSRTQDSGRVIFYSRSRERLWEKGETSGNALRLVSITPDCDGDALLVRAEPEGPTCHTGTRSCFSADQESGSAGLAAVLAELALVVRRRDQERPAGSYTASLLDAGALRIGQKVAEEAVETALAVASEPHRVPEESADLLYHLIVLWQHAGVSFEDVAALLAQRRIST
jgi:phosphoribosyl-ATP pyrophosphohydrolase/phosphoribosyl-AMP cyclohydrolase